MNISNYLLSIVLSLVLLNNTVSSTPPDTAGNCEIRMQNLNVHLAQNSLIFRESLLSGEILDTEIYHVILTDSHSQSESLSQEYDTVFLFIKGEGRFKAGDQVFIVRPECIAFPVSLNCITIEAAESDTLHYIIVRKKLSQKDMIDLKSFPKENRSDVYFANYNDCKAYTEKIKSLNTVSRTVLPKGHIPRVAMGTVKAIGPDKVKAHQHPMLDQLFLGLAGNDVMVHADDHSIHFPEFALLHIPIGSTHWVTVEDGKQMYYQWMDFFLTKEGEIWLKTHKPVSRENK